MADAHDFGRLAERIAAAFLERNGWTLLHRNWRWHRKEIDLVARLGNTVAFIEVKARRSLRFGHPLEAITWSKRRDLEAAARAWILLFGRSGDAYRFDAIWLLPASPGEPAVPHHVENAWSL